MVDAAQEVIALVSAKVRNRGASVELTDRLEDLGITSLDAVELIFDLEEKFDIEIPYNANAARRQPGTPRHGYPRTDLDTVGDVARAVERLVREKA